MLSFVRHQSQQLLTTSGGLLLRRTLCSFSRSESLADVGQQSQLALRQQFRCLATKQQQQALSSSSSGGNNDQGDTGKKQQQDGTNNSNKTALLIGTAAGAVITAYLLWGDRFTGKSGDLKSSSLGKDQSDCSSKQAAVLTEPIADLPESVPYLIIGAGTAGFGALRTIRSHDPKARVIVIGDEPNQPYMRPPISKELWLTEPDLAKKFSFRQWNDKEKSIFFEHPEFYCSLKENNEGETGGVSVVTGHRVIKLDPLDQIAHLDNGQKIKYNKCLIATGGRPKTAPAFENLSQQIKSKLISFRTLDDFKRLDKLVSSGKTIAIIGGGFLGSELACSLSRKVQMLKTRGQIYEIVQEKGNLGKVLPEFLSEWTTNMLREDGVNIITQADVKSVELQGDRLALTLTNGEKLVVDAAVLAVGLEPNVDLAQDAGLEICPETGGLHVNSELLARTNLWAAGDVASFYDTQLGRRRVEHHDHAIVSGRLAGENMATGAGKHYYHQSIFWSDLGPRIGFEAIGLVDASLPTVSVFTKSEKCDDSLKGKHATADSKEQKDSKQAKDSAPQYEASALRIPSDDDEFYKGVIFYLKNDVVVGMVLWNVFNKMSIARRVLAECRKFDDLVEVAKLFDLNKDYLDEYEQMMAEEEKERADSQQKSGQAQQNSASSK